MVEGNAANLKVVQLHRTPDFSEDDKVSRNIIRDVATMPREFAAVGIVVVYKDGNVGTTFYGADRVFALSGGIQHLNDRLHREIINPEGDRDG